MFGLLRVPKGYLAQTEQEIYQAHYCGICHAFGRRGFPGLRLATSYDAAALALFFSGLSGVQVEVAQRSCPFSPWRKKSMALGREEVFDFAAAASLGIAKLKAEDELSDGCSAVKEIFVKGIHRYLSAKAPNWGEFAKVRELQATVEKQPDPWFDELAYPSGLLIGSLAARAAQENNRDAGLAFKVGENLGKWIYTWDALWDFSDDQQQGRFNALSAAYGLTVEQPRDFPEEVLAEMDFVLERCHAEIIANINMLNLGTPGQILTKLITGAHSWHKRTYVEEFFQGEGAHERLPRTWHNERCRQTASTGSGVRGQDQTGSTER